MTTTTQEHGRRTMKCESCGQELPEVAVPEGPGTQAWYLAAAVPRLRRLEELAEAAYPSDPARPHDPAARREWDRLMNAQCADECAAGL